MDDAVPRTLEGAVLSIADKADSIAGMFALGLQPTGSKDPFALRRQANGIVKIIAEKQLPIDVSMVLKQALTPFRSVLRDKTETSVQALLYLSLRERIEFYLRDVLGFAYDVVSAVLAPGGMEITDIIARAESVGRILESEDFQQIAVAFKRIKNILSQARQTQREIGHGMMFEYLEEEPEKRLAALVSETRDVVEKTRQLRDYDRALSQVATLRPAVDIFFDKIMVMVDDSKLRAARLGLLAELLKNFSTIADFSEIVTERKS
jgi:glycyl-tRNA synthetase beta chain